MFENREGLIWPEGDRGLYGHRHTVEDVDRMLEFVPKRGVCVQAGGAAGMWPAKLSQSFNTVYTFEPNAVLFYCLCRNAPQLNVVKFNAALGDKPGLIQVENPEKEWNYGSYYVSTGGAIPTMRIDDLALKELDFLLLDIEGYELRALVGAERTLARCKPIIVVEAHDFQYWRFGDSLSKLQGFLKELGYRRRDEYRSPRDWLFSQ